MRTRFRGVLLLVLALGAPCLAYLVVAAAVAGTFPTTGIASYYSGELDGKLTASSEPYRRTGFTAASYDFYGKTLQVTNLRNGKSVVVRVNDRGPAKRLNRVLDLSEAAFAEIATGQDIQRGLMSVSFREVPSVKPRE